MAGATAVPSPVEEVPEIPSPTVLAEQPSPAAAHAPEVAATPPAEDGAAAAGAEATTGSNDAADTAGIAAGGAATSAAELAASRAAAAETAAGAAETAADDVREPPQKVARVEDTSHSDYRAALVAHFSAEETKSGQSQDWARAAEMQALKA